MAGIAILFWYNEWKFTLPTPVPKNYTAVNFGKNISIAKKIPHHDKPLFLHFFNPKCPCSKFNIPYFKELVKKYSNQVDFQIVLMSDKRYTAEQIRNKFDLNIPVLFDSAIALECGVYSTPQAAIIDSKDNLFYRGNYNKSRYCTDGKTKFAEQALNNLLYNNRVAIYDRLALKAYGCALQSCTKN